MFSRYLCIAALGFTAVFANDKCEIVNLTTVTQDFLDEFAKGKIQDKALEFPAGVSLPLRIFLKGEFLALEPQESAPVGIKILKTCFVKYKGETFFFSTDASNWKEFSEFFTGKIGASIGLEDKSLYAGLEGELYQRKGS